MHAVERAKSKVGDQEIVVVRQESDAGPGEIRTDLDAGHEHQRVPKIRRDGRIRFDEKNCRHYDSSALRQSRCREKAPAQMFREAVSRHRATSKIRYAWPGGARALLSRR